MALLLVLSVLAVATVMGAALLSSSSLQASVSSNTLSIAAAESLAESGVNYAMYKLQSATEEEIGRGEFWGGQSGISLGSNTSGTIDITVTRPDATKQQYLIESTGNSDGITRRISATIELNMTFQPKHAVVFNGGLTLPLSMTVVGPLKSSGVVILLNSALMQGRVRAVSIVGPPWPTDWELLPSGTPVGVPTSYRDYLTYQVDGVSYSAQKLGGTIDKVTLSPSASNPAGIFWTDGDVTIKDNVTINGTLVVKKKSGGTEGRLTVEGANSKIVAQPGYPALIVEDRVIMKGLSRALKVYGLCWINTSITRSGASQLNSTFEVYGSLLMAGVGVPIDPLYTGKVRAEYNEQYLDVPDFSTSNNAPESVTVLSWERSSS